LVITSLYAGKSIREAGKNHNFLLYDTQKICIIERNLYFLHNNISYEGLTMVFTSKRSAALLLMSSASLFSMDSNLVSADSASSKEFIQKLQAQCATLNGLLGKWTIESDKSVEAEKVRKELCDGKDQMQWSFGYSKFASALLELHRDKSSTHIAYALGVHQHIDTIFKRLSTNKFLWSDDEPHMQTLKDYAAAAALIAQLDAQHSPNYINAVDITGHGNINGNIDGIRNPIDLLTQATKQTQNNAEKVILLERLVADQEERTRGYEKVFLQAIESRRENEGQRKLNEELTKEKKELAMTIAIDMVNAKDKIEEMNLAVEKYKLRGEQLEQKKEEIVKECNFQVAKQQATIDALVAKVRNLENENTALRNSSKGSLLGSWFGSSSSDKRE
jgi:hypothetical protein